MLLRAEQIAGAAVFEVEFREAVARAFATWEAVPTSSIHFAQTGVSDREPSDNDGVTLLAFANRPELDRTLGATSYTVDVVSGTFPSGNPLLVLKLN